MVLVKEQWSLGSWMTIALIFIGAGAIIYFASEQSDVGQTPEEAITVDEDVDFFAYYEEYKSGDEDYTVIDAYMRSENNFLQGLYFDSDTRLFYESSGLYGYSHIQRLEPSDSNTMIISEETKSEKPITLVPNLVSNLPSTDFGEGLSPRSASEFVVLTWQERKIYTVERSTMDIQSIESLDNAISEGWGVTADESQVNSNGFYQLYISDGTSNIYLVDGETLQVTDTISVFDPETNTNLKRINELEFVNGYIYANIWQTSTVIKIDPSTGIVAKTYDMSSLRNVETAFQLDHKGTYTGDTLNGIAYDATTDSFFFSGKKYHLIFKIKLE